MPQRFAKLCPACKEPRPVRKVVWKAYKKAAVETGGRAFLNCGCVIRKALRGQA